MDDHPALGAPADVIAPFCPPATICSNVGNLALAVRTGKGNSTPGSVTASRKPVVAAGGGGSKSDDVDFGLQSGIGDWVFTLPT